MKTVNNDANTAYKAKAKTITAMLRGLDKTLANHAKRQKNDPTNWGLVGDLESITSNIADIIRFIS